MTNKEHRNKMTVTLAILVSAYSVRVQRINNFNTIDYSERVLRFWIAFRIKATNTKSPISPNKAPFKPVSP